MVWMLPLILVMFQETVRLCKVLCLFLLFYCVVWYFCVSLWMLPRAWSSLSFPFSIPCFSTVIYILCIRLSIFRYPAAFYWMPIINWFNNNPNVDVGNAFWSSIMFPLNAYGIKFCLKYWSIYPMINHVITHMVSSSYMSGFSEWTLMYCLNFRSSFELSHCSTKTFKLRTF